MYTITKKFRNLPAAHRQHMHGGHCSQIHGHEWGFDVTFTSTKLDENNFVVDFGRLKLLRSWFEEHFDHTLLLNQDDPQLPRLREVLGHTGLARIIVVPSCGAEGLAKFVFESFHALFSNTTDEYLSRLVRENGLSILAVTVHEDDKNNATYQL